MSSDAKWSFRLKHILDAIARIQQYTAGHSEQSFAAEQMAVDAVIRNFQILGEAAGRVPDDVQQSNPHIPWLDIQKMRHVLVHHYDKVDVGRVWQTVQQDLPPLVEPLRRLLDSLPDGV